MDPSYYSPQTSKGHHHNGQQQQHSSPTMSSEAATAVCYCRVHGTMAQGQYFPTDTYSPSSPVTRQLMQQHPEAIVIQTGSKPAQMVPCHVVYHHHHQPVFGYMAHNTLDGATAIARQRRQQKNKSCQDPRCCSHQVKSNKPNHKSATRHRKSKHSQSPSKSAKVSNYKSAPSSPVGTPRKLVNLTQCNNRKKQELSLDPQWITAFPTLETPSESGFPITTSGKLTGCCGRTTITNPTANRRRPRSNSYSALDSTSDDGVSQDLDPVKSFSNKNQVV